MYISYALMPDSPSLPNSILKLLYLPNYWLFVNYFTGSLFYKFIEHDYLIWKDFFEFGRSGKIYSRVDCIDQRVDSFDAELKMPDYDEETKEKIDGK